MDIFSKMVLGIKRDNECVSFICGYIVNAVCFEALNGLDQPLQHRLLPYFYMLFIHMIVSSGDKAKKQSPGSSTFQL